MIKRRQILQMAGLACAVEPCAFLLANPEAEADLKLLAVRDAQALPVFSAGDLLLADTRQTRFAGDGIYLYPSWGTPRPYMVKVVELAGQGQMLEFRNPGSGQLLWAQSTVLDDQFAGRLVEHFSRPYARSQTSNYPMLRLPALPLNTGIPRIISNISATV